MLLNFSVEALKYARVCGSSKKKWTLQHLSARFSQLQSPREKGKFCALHSHTHVHIHVRMRMRMQKIFTTPEVLRRKEVMCGVHTRMHAIIIPPQVCKHTRKKSFRTLARTHACSGLYTEITHLLTYKNVLCAYRDAPILVVIDEMDALLEAGPHQQTLCTLFEWPKREPRFYLVLCILFEWPRRELTSYLVSLRSCCKCWGIVIYKLTLHASIITCLIGMNTEESITYT
jgi:hypothetical protein